MQIAFTNYGSHADAYPTAYFTAACALGAREADVDLFLKRLDKTLKDWKKMKPPPPPKSLAEPSAAAPPPDAPPTDVAPTDDGSGAAATPPANAPAALTPTPPVPPPHAEPDRDARETAPPQVAADARLEGFAILAEAVAYKRYLQVEDRLVRYPDGGEAAFDIVGHPKNRYQFVVVFAYHTEGGGGGGAPRVTMLREFAQAAPPHAAMMWNLPTGGYDPPKHCTLLAAAKAELSEEARLAGGTWHSLLPEGHAGVLESKWCRNRFFPFLCVDPVHDAAPGARDAEEHIDEVKTLTLPELRAAMAGGELLPPALQTCVCALERLRRESKAP